MGRPSCFAPPLALACSWALRYEQLMRHLAGHGFIVIAPTVDDNVFAPNFWVRCAYWQMGPFS